MGQNSDDVDHFPSSSTSILSDDPFPSSFTTKSDMQDAASNPTSNNEPSLLLSKLAPAHLFTPVVLSILVTETAERFAYFGFRALLVLFFTKGLLLDENTAISGFAYTTCLANFSPLLGATLAERWGRFRTILTFGCLYAVGLMILTQAAFLHNDDDEVDVDQEDPHRSTSSGVDDSLRTLFWKRALTCAGLVLVCIGTGGIKPVVNIFGADQVALKSDRILSTSRQDAHEEQEEQEIIGRTATTQTGLDVVSVQEDDDHAVREFFNFFYFCINIGAVTSFATIPMVKVYFGFGMAFLLPTIFMMLALCLFYSKRKQYIHRDQRDDKVLQERSDLAKTFSMCLQLILHKIRSTWGWRHPREHQLVSQQDDAEPEREPMHELVVRSQAHNGPNLVHNETDQSSSSHVKTPSWANNQMELEDAHQALQILPIMAMLPIFWMLYDQQGSVWTLQASRMALHGFEPEQLNMLNPLEIIVLIPLFDRVIYPAMEERKWSIPPLRRMGWGMILASLSFIVSGLLEQAIELSPKDSVSVLWQVPQITILAVGEIFLSVTGLEYAYSKSPDRLKGFIMAIYLLTVAVGDLLGGILYSSVFRRMDRAVVMHVCATLMILNRLVFAWVVAITQHDSAVSDEASLLAVTPVECHGTDAMHSDDKSTTCGTKATAISHRSFDGSKRMIGESSSIAGKSVGDGFSSGVDGGMDDGWMHLEMPTAEII